MGATEVAGALIWRGDRFLICQRPAHKARGLLWEFVGGKVEPGETRQQALIRECQEELGVTVTVGEVFLEVDHVYPDLTVHLTLFRAAIPQGEPRKLEHNDIRWITAGEIPLYDFCPADREILARIREDAGEGTAPAPAPRFDERFFQVRGEAVDLRLIDAVTPDSGDLPFYWWEILRHPDRRAVGKISLRLGRNLYCYYNGHIGYEVDEPYRGHHYALLACRMVLDIARAHGMDRLYLTCDRDNVPSCRTIERLGGVLLEEMAPPPGYLHYYEGIPPHRIYELRL